MGGLLFLETGTRHNPCCHNATLMHEMYTDTNTETCTHIYRFFCCVDGAHVALWTYQPYNPRSSCPLTLHPKTARLRPGDVLLAWDSWNPNMQWHQG